MHDVYVNFSQLFLKFCQDYTYRSTSTELPTERNKFDWVKLSLDISLRFSLLSLTRHNDDILGLKHPLRWGGASEINLYTPETCGDPTNYLTSPVSKMLDKTLCYVRRCRRCGLEGLPHALCDVWLRI